MPPKVLSLSLMLALLSVGAHAQTVYRIVGPDGKVTFSDRAPDTAAKPAQTTAGKYIRINISYGNSHHQQKVLQIKPRLDERAHR